MWTALSLGTFADNILRQALLIGIPAGLISVPFFSSPDHAIPLIGALLPAGLLIFSSISGQLADKYETAMMFRRTKFAEIILMSIAAIAFITGAGWLAIIMLFAMGAQSAFFSPVRVAAMPKYLHTDELIRGNGLCNAGLFTFILLGYAVGGYFIVQENGDLQVGILLVLAALGGWSVVLFTPKAAPNDPALKLSFNPIGQTAAMFAKAFASPGVAPPLFGIGVFYFFSTAITVATPLYGRDSLQADPLVWTALNAMFAVGAGLGAIVAASLPKSGNGLAASTIAIIAAGLFSISIFFLTPHVAGSADAPLTIGGLFSTWSGRLLTFIFIATAGLTGVYITPLQAAMQRRAPHPTRARIMAASTFSNAAFAIPGSFSVLAVTRGVSPELFFVLIGAIMVCIGGVMILRGARLPQGFNE